MSPGALAGTAALAVAAAVAILVAGAALPGVDVAGFWSALAAVVVAAAFNALLWPTIARITLPLNVLTLGFAALALNGAVVLLVAGVLSGLEVDNLGAAILVTLLLTAFTTLVASLLSIDVERRVSRHSMRRAIKREAGGAADDPPGVLFLEIDGLAYDVVRRAMRDGNAPALAAWVRDGSHRLMRWETDWSSQTGACQAGLLHGSNEDMPAFRWWEKDRGRAIVTNHPRDAAELERRVSDGRGLLHADGASRANILSGDAPHSLLTMSTVLAVRRKGQRIGHDYYAYFADPYNVARTLLLSFADIARELRAAGEQRRHDVRPRVHRGLKYSFLRAWATVVQLHLQVEAVLADVYAGRPVVYTTFLAYDEVAHHSGIERPDTLAVLRAVDREIARIARAAEEAPRRYELVVLADHGQSQGATFLQRYGVGLDALVQELCAAEHVESAGGDDEAAGRIGAALSEAARDESAQGRIVRRVAARQLEAPQEDGELPEVVVMASGCLGLISFPREPGRMTRARLEERYPALLPGLAEHPGIAFALVDGEVIGSLEPFGPNAGRHVARTSGFAHCPDVVVNSRYWEDSDEVAAFEELVGSHGGMGGTQSFPFALVPSGFAEPDEEVVGAEAMHRLMRRWLADLGHEAFAVAEKASR